MDEQIFSELMINRIYDQIHGADIIIADMTGRSPNVFYEVGYAHALGKRVILLASTTADIPFDLRMHQHLIYNGSITTAKNGLAKILKHIRSLPIEKDYSIQNLEIRTLRARTGRTVTIDDFISLNGGEPVGISSGASYNVPAELSNFGGGFFFQFALQIVNKGNSEIDLSPLEWQIAFPSGVKLAEASLRSGLGRTSIDAGDLTITTGLSRASLKPGAADTIIVHLQSNALVPGTERELRTSFPVNLRLGLYDEIWAARIDLVLAPWRRLN